MKEQKPRETTLALRPRSCALLGEQRRLHQVTDLKLLENVGYVVYDRLLGEEELLADLLVAVALRQELQ